MQEASLGNTASTQTTYEQCMRNAVASDVKWSCKIGQSFKVYSNEKKEYKNDEDEAAHIRPVEHNGPDIISNGIALSGTAHWMFDRGLVGYQTIFRSLSPDKSTILTQ